MKPLNQLTAQEIVEYFKKVDRKTWIKIACAIVVALIVIVGFIWPAWVTRLELRNKIKMTQGQILAMGSLSQNKPKLLKSKEDYSAFIKTSKDSLFRPGEAALLLGTIAKFANDSKVNLVASNPKEYRDKFAAPFDGLYEGFLYDFTLEGGYHDLAEFIAKIETNPRLLRIEEFHLASLGAGENLQDEHRLLATITLSAVAMKENK